MREILFKAKTTKKQNRRHAFDNVWVVGDLIRSGGKYYIHPVVNKVNVVGELGKIIIMHEVLPDTICQYTGQRYKCGKKVSENDIVTISAYSYDEPESDTTGIVVYSKGKACWCLKDLNSDEIIPMYECYGSYITQISYIGNTFDNPDLLEVK